MIAQYSVNFDCSESGDIYTVLNASTTRGFFVTGVLMSWEPNTMAGPSANLPVLQINRYTGLASGGTAGAIFSYTDGDIPATSVLIGPTSLGTIQSGKPSSLPGSPDLAQYSGSSWSLKGGQVLTDFNGARIYVAPGNSLQVHVTYLAECCVFFHENLTI